MYVATGEVLADTAAIVAKLTGTDLDQIVPYTAISQAIGRDIQQRRSALNRAQRELADKELYFITVRGVGMQRVTADQYTVWLSEQLPVKIRRQAARHKTRLNQVDYGKLKDSETKLRWIASHTYATAIKMFSKSSGQRKLTEECRRMADSSELPVGNVLKLFQ